MAYRRDRNLVEYYRRRSSRAMIRLVVLGAAFGVGAISTLFTDYDKPMAAAGKIVEKVASKAVYFPNCKTAWALKKAPIYSGQPGYRSDLDGDSDGIACEPIYRR